MEMRNGKQWEEQGTGKVPLEQEKSCIRDEDEAEVELALEGGCNRCECDYGIALFGTYTRYTVKGREGVTHHARDGYRRDSPGFSIGQAGRAVNATCGEKHFACLNFLPVAVWSENWIDFLN